MNATTKHFQPGYELRRMLLTLTKIEQPAVLLVSAIVALTLSMTKLFIEQWIWDPLWALYLLWIVFAMDFITGTLVSMWVRKHDWKTRRLGVFLGRVVFCTFTLGFLHLMPVLNTITHGPPEIGPALDLTARIIYGLLILNIFASVLKNGVLCGFIPEPVAKYIYKYVDSYKDERSDKLYQYSRKKE